MITRVWDRYDPRLDRSAGALLGAATALCMAGAAPAQAQQLVEPKREGGPARRLAWLVEQVLIGLDDDAVGAVGADEQERSWALALRRTVAEGVVVPPAGEVAGARGGAWRVVAETPVPELVPRQRRFPCGHYEHAVRAAQVVGGQEAAMYAGALAGARWGASGVPLAPQRELARQVAPRRLVTAALAAVCGVDADQWPHRRSMSRAEDEAGHEVFGVAHPHDAGVVLSTLEYVRLREDFDAVVSLCRVGSADIPERVAGPDRVEVWLADHPGVNANLHFVIDQAAQTVAALRAEGKRVALHCAACQSRTPAVAAHYAALACGAEVVASLRQVIETVAGHLNNPELAGTSAALHGVELDDPAAVLFPDGLPVLTRTPRT
ncbi:protein-tyrosine phosphatase family protein [Salinactinospora qingdaonensis]|uniref:Secreted protein n=1 Tax=Salinactinospora qingdaonensis TaxID=702744 RepID=A0ABP7GK35_9ACTN